LEEAREPEPGELAGIYRRLRKGREDAKNEPGAGDFYYGECEMRRHAPTTPWAERLVLRLYWLTCGYALRASRALCLLLVVLAAATALLATVGFPPPAPPPATVMITGSPPIQQLHIQPPAPATVTASRSLPARLGSAALIALEGAVFRTPDQQLTYRGRLVQTAVRLVGPLLLGLALLSIRGRVKR
jgi:hypothetical protein